METFLLIILLIILIWYKIRIKIINNKSTKNLYQCAIEYMNKKNYKKAKKEFQKLISLGEENENILFQYGLTLYHLKEYDNSLVSYNKALDLSENNSLIRLRIYQSIAKIWDIKKEYNKSIIFYNKSIEVSNKILKR